MIHEMYENQQIDGSGLVSEDLWLKMSGMVAELSEMRSRLAALEQMRAQ